MAETKRRNVSLKTLKSLLKLVNEHKLDFLEFNGIKVQKTRHALELPAAATTGKGKKGDKSGRAPDPTEAPTSLEELDASVDRMLGRKPAGTLNV